MKEYNWPTMVMMGDHKCLASSMKGLSRKICRNNCSNWKDQKCERGYNSKNGRKTKYKQT